MGTSAEQQYLLGIDEKLRKSSEGLNKNLQQDSGLSNIRLGRISANNNDGSYTVDLLGSDGSAVQSITAFPIGSASLGDNSLVVVFWNSLSNPIPYIISSGGGGFSAEPVACFAEFTN